MRWVLPEVSPHAEALARDLGVAPFVAGILCARGFHEPERARNFLKPRLAALSDPFLLPDMDAAVARVLQAIDREERIVLFGDYDVDGVSSLALLTRVLRAYGAEPARFLPQRIEEGYGLSADGVSRCLATHAPQLLIAVDCGTSSCAEIADLCGRGVDVVVLDHHECTAALPACIALVNPKRGAGFHYLCSVGLVFKLAHALLKRRAVPGFDLRAHLDLVALGTVADLVPLVEENRTLVKRGLVQLGQSRSVGVRALIEAAGLRAPFTCVDVGFGLGPRLNAAGRLGTAQDALELLLTDDPSRARTLAFSLDQQNRERRAVEDAVYAEAEAQLAGWFDAEKDAAIVVGSAGWHPGVVGIVASRLQRRHHRPAVVIGFDEAGQGKGSGRSIVGLSLVAALGDCGHLLEKFGGHEMAAGLSVTHDRFLELRDAFRASARARLSDEQLRPRLHVHAEVGLGAVDFSLLEHHAALAPFGMANPEPTLFARAVTLAAEPRVLKDKHLSLMLRQGRHEHRAIWFNGVAETIPRLPWDVAFSIESNEYQGLTTPQMRIRAVRSAE